MPVVIIHESRFTYPDYGLHKVIDLGEWGGNYGASPFRSAVFLPDAISAKKKFNKLMYLFAPV